MGAFSQYKDKVIDFCNYCRQNKPQVGDLCNAIESSMKQMDPMQNAQMHVQESYQKQQQQQQQPQSYGQQQPNYNEVKQVKKNSVVQDDNNYGQPQYNEPAPVSNDAVPDIGQTKSFAECQKLNVPNKEAYLHDQEFQQIFGMTKQEFYQQRPWKQKNLKRAKGLF